MPQRKAELDCLVNKQVDTGDLTEREYYGRKLLLSVEMKRRNSDKDYAKQDAMW